MKRTILAFFTAAAWLAASGQATFTGIISDSMCVEDHAHMNAGADPDCVKACVKSSDGKYKYVLFNGSQAFKLSDQATPEQFAGKKVKVTGTLYEKTGIIKVEKIETLK